jgi:hypothetical protein
MDASQIIEETPEERRKRKNREAQKRYRERNRDKVNAASKAWRDANPEAVAERNLRYRKENPEKAQAATARWRANNRERVNESRREWVRNNPEKAKAMRQRGKAGFNQTAHGRRRRRKMELVDLLGGKCMDCHQVVHLYAFEFDHVRGEKVGTLSRLLQGRWEAAREEALKCDLVCANCHRVRTALRLGMVL